MTGYQKLKQQYEEMKRWKDFESHRATVYWIAMMSHIDRNSEQLEKIKETAKYLFMNYKEEDHQYDPLLKIYEKR